MCTACGRFWEAVWFVSLLAELIRLCGGTDAPSDQTEALCFAPWALCSSVIECGVQFFAF